MHQIGLSIPLILLVVVLLKLQGSAGSSLQAAPGRQCLQHRQLLPCSAPVKQHGGRGEGLGAGGYPLWLVIGPQAYGSVCGQLLDAVSQLCSHALQRTGICLVACVASIHLNWCEPKLPVRKG